MGEQVSDEEEDCLRNTQTYSKLSENEEDDRAMDFEDDGFKLTYISNEVQKFLRENRVMFTESTADNYQQNSLVEKCHQDLMNMSRALIYEENLPKRIWIHL